MKPKTVRPPEKAKVNPRVGRKRGPYKKANARLDKKVLLQIDSVGYQIINDVVDLLGVKDRSAFVRLAIAKALLDLPDLIVRTVDLIAHRYILREVARELGRAETVIEWGLPKAQAALRNLQWTPSSQRKIDEVMEVISLKREGKNVRNVGCFAKTSYARSLSPEEAAKILNYLCSPDSSPERSQLRADLDVLVSKLIQESFARRKEQFLNVPKLQEDAKKAGYKPAEILDHWNDPEWLQILIDHKLGDLVKSAPDPSTIS